MQRAAPEVALYLLVDEQRLDLGAVRTLKAESFGEPGNRTFRILAETDDGRVSLWLEKEQIVVLGSAMQDLLRRVPSSASEASESAKGSQFVGELEVKVGSLALGFDAQDRTFAIEASDFQSVFELSTIAFLVNRRQFEEVQTQITEIVSGGRPRCPLCGSPLVPAPHFCPPSNGHAQLKN